jgi:hypothetical protein
VQHNGTSTVSSNGRIQANQRELEHAERSVRTLQAWRKHWITMGRATTARSATPTDGQKDRERTRPSAESPISRTFLINTNDCTSTAEACTPQQQRETRTLKTSAVVPTPRIVHAVAQDYRPENGIRRKMKAMCRDERGPSTFLHFKILFNDGSLRVASDLTAISIKYVVRSEVTGSPHRGTLPRLSVRPCAGVSTVRRRACVLVMNCVCVWPCLLWSGRPGFAWAFLSAHFKSGGTGRR